MGSPKRRRYDQVRQRARALAGDEPSGTPAPPQTRAVSSMKFYLSRPERTADSPMCWPTPGGFPVLAGR